MGIALRILAFPDWHLPFDHEKASAEAIYITKHYKPDVFVSVGDMFDGYAVSGHDRDPAKHTNFRAELAESHITLDRLLAVLPSKCARYITLGNHEDRLRRYVWRKAPEFSGLLSLDDPFGLVARGFTVIPFRRMLKIGKVHFSHMKGGSGVNAARVALQKVHGNIVCGHNHRAAIVYETNARGQAHFGATIGWLGDPAHTLDYMDEHAAQTEWMHSIMTLDMDKRGCAVPHIHPIF